MLKSKYDSGSKWHRGRTHHCSCCAVHTVCQQADYTAFKMCDKFVRKSSHVPKGSTNAEMSNGENV
jgi:hypothetical protein